MTFPVEGEKVLLRSPKVIPLSSMFAVRNGRRRRKRMADEERRKKLTQRRKGSQGRRIAYEEG